MVEIIERHIGEARLIIFKYDPLSNATSDSLPYSVYDPSRSGDLVGAEVHLPNSECLCLTYLNGKSIEHHLWLNDFAVMEGNHHTINAELKSHGLSLESIAKAVFTQTSSATSPQAGYLEHSLPEPIHDEQLQPQAP